MTPDKLILFAFLMFAIGHITAKIDKEIDKEIDNDN